MHSSGACWCTEPLWSCGRVPSSPSSPSCHTTAQPHKQGLHWEPSSSFLGGLLFPDNAEITSAIVASISDCIALQKQTHKVSDWLEPRAGLHNQCLHQTYQQHVRTKGVLETHKTVPSSHRHLTFDFNSHSPGIDLIALWGRIPADSEPSPHSVVCLSAWITHYLQFWHSLSLCHDILSEVPWPSKEKSFLHYRGVQNG